MRNDSFNQHLIAQTGKHLSRKPGEPRFKNKEEALVISSQPPSIKSYPRRATTPVFRNVLLGITLSSLISQEVSAQEKQEEILDKKSDDIFKAPSGPLSQPNSTNPLFKTRTKDVFRNLIKTHRDNFLAQPNKELVFNSFPEEILSGFLNQKNFNHKDKGPLTFTTYLAYNEHEQANFLGILKHSVSRSRENTDLLNLLTSQVDDKGNNILHISCIMNNVNHLDAIFQNFHTAHFSFNNRHSEIDRFKKNMIMKFNDDQFTPLMQAVKDNKLEMVNKILSQSKSFDDVDYSFDVLMQVNKSGNSPLLLAIQNKNYQLTESLLVNFDSYSSEQKTQIQNVFKDSHKQISDDLQSSAVQNNSTNISQIIKTLKKINYSKVELKDLLTAKNNKGDSAIILLAFKKEIDSIIEIINEFDGKKPEERKLIKEILLQPNKNGNSALDLLIANNADDKIIEVINALKSKFSKIELKDLLTTQNDRKSGDSAIILLAFHKKIDSILEIIKEFAGEKPEERKLLKEILLQPNKNEKSALDLLIANNPDDKIIEALKALKDKFGKDDLKDLLTAKNSNGDSAIIILAFSKKIKSILEIIKEFNTEEPEQKKLLQEILLQPSKSRNSALDLLIANNPDDKIIEVINALKSKFSKIELKDLLTTQNGQEAGDSAITLLAFHKKIDSILEIINEFDDKKPEERKLLKEILLQPNKNGNSALNLLIANNPDDKIIEVINALKSKFSKIELKDLLTAKNSKGDSAITLLAFHKNITSILEIINEFDDKKPEERKLLEKILLQRNENGDSPLDLLIDNNPDDKIIEVINALKSKFSKTELKDLLTAKNSKGDSAIILLAFHKKIDSILGIIKYFNEEPTTRNSQLMEIFLNKTIKNGRNVMHHLFTENQDDSIIAVIETLKDVKFNPSKLKELLIDEDNLGLSSIHILATKGRINSILSVISAFDIDKEDDRNHLKEIFLKRDGKGFSVLNVLINDESNKSALKCIKKIISIFNDEEIEELLHKKVVKDRRILPISTSLILAGNHEVVEEILKRNVEIKIDELPISYYANIPNVAVYYLEAFRKDPNNQIKEIKYYNSDNKDGVDILNLKLNDNRGDPLIVEIIGTDDSSRKVIITETYIKNSKNKINGTNLNLQNTFQLAEFDKIDQIIINLNIGNYNYSNDSYHEITIKLTKNDDGWDAVYHDPNSLAIIGFSRSEEWKQTNENAIKAICEQNNIKIKSVTEHENIIANDRLGSCDTIASIVGASMIIGDDHSKKLATKCKEYFSYATETDKSKILSLDGCINHLGGDELNKEVKSILEAKLELIKSKIDKAPSSIISPDGNSTSINSKEEVR